MSDEPEPARPTLGSDQGAAREATEATVRLVKELQAGLDQHDAEADNRHFADDVLWGSPFGATVHGYEQLHAIHVRPVRQGRGGPSRYEIKGVLAPPRTSPSHTSGASRSIPTAAHSSQLRRRGRLLGDGALRLVRRDGTRWLAAGQNTPVRPPPTNTI